MTTAGWWAIALVWVVVCALILLFNHGAHKGDDDES